MPGEPLTKHADLGGPDFRLDGKVALVTGAGRGIGLGMARALAAHGCAVAIQDVDEAVAAQETARIRDAGGKAVALGGDVIDLALPACAVAETVRKLGGLHVLINNAAIQSKQDWLDVSAEEIERTFRADLTSPILFAQAAFPIFRRQRFGRLINVGSIQGKRGNAEMLPYAMAKAALENMTVGLARQHAPEGITVNLVAPGWFNTYRNRGDFAEPGSLEQKGKFIPVGRIGEPEDAGGLAVLLCSKAGEYITGQTIYLDGGISVR